jgi:hypothetical protein
VLRAVVIAGSVVALSGCLSADSSVATCRIDDHCAADESCTRTGECAAGSLIEARIAWTVGGRQVSADAPEACEQAGIASLSVSFADSGADDTTYQPISCPQGAIVFDRMPPRFDRLLLLAVDDRGDVIARASAPLAQGVNEIALDLAP